MFSRDCLPTAWPGIATSNWLVTVCSISVIIFGVICAGAAAARRGCYRWTVTSLPLQLRPVPGSACVSPSSAPAAGGATGEDARQEHGRGDESRHARWRGEVHDGPPLPPRSPRGVRPPLRGVEGWIPAGWAKKSVESRDFRSWNVGGA